MVLNTVINMVETGLIVRIKPTDPHWNWFSVGVGIAIAHNLLSEYLGQAEIKKFDTMDDIEYYKQYEKELNLRYWLVKDVHIEAPLEYELKLLGARCEYARLEIERLIEKHGIEVVRKILDEISGKESRNSEDLIRAIQKVTGEDMGKRFLLCQSFETKEQGINKYVEAFNEASQKKDYERMLINLVRLHEIRPMLFSKTCLMDYKEAAVLLAKLGHERQADETMHRCMSLFGDSPEGQLIVMQAYLMYVLDCRKPRKGLAFAEEILKHRPDNTMALTVQMLSEAETGRIGKAKETARVIQALVPEDKREESLPYKFASRIISFDPSKANGSDPNKSNVGD